MNVFFRVSMIVLCIHSGVIFASESRAENAFSTLSVGRDIEALKKEVTELNRDLFALQEQVLFPVKKQLVVFFSMAAETKTDFSEITLTLDGQVITQQGYSVLARRALRRGGIQRLFIGAVSTGKHILRVRIGGGNGREKKFSFKKKSAAKTLELQLHGTSKLTLKEWN